MKVIGSFNKVAKKEVTKVSHPWGWDNIELVEDREGGEPINGSQATIKMGGKELLTFTYVDEGKKGSEFYATDTKIKDANSIADLLVAFIQK